MSDSFMQRAFSDAKVIPHVDPNRFTIDLLGDARERLPVGEWDCNLGRVLQLAAMGEAVERHAMNALAEVKS